MYRMKRFFLKKNNVKHNVRGGMLFNKYVQPIPRRRTRNSARAFGQAALHNKLPFGAFSLLLPASFVGSCCEEIGLHSFLNSLNGVGPPPPPHCFLRRSLLPPQDAQMEKAPRGEVLKWDFFYGVIGISAAEPRERGRERETPRGEKRVQYGHKSIRGWRGAGATVCPLRTEADQIARSPESNNALSPKLERAGRVF